MSEYSPEGFYLGEELVFPYDDTTRTYTDHFTGETRPYTDEENAAADARAVAAAEEANRLALETSLANSIERLTTTIENLRVISGKTNADITARDTKDVARASRIVAVEVRKMARLISRQLSTIESDA